MKIHNSNHIAKLQSSYQQTSTNPNKEKLPRKQESDQLKISTQAQQILKQKTEGQTIDDMKVQRIKEQIAEGSYKINGDEIAGKLLSLWHNALNNKGRSE